MFMGAECMVSAMAKQGSAFDNILLELRTYGLSYPGAHLKSPWPGHKDLAVDDKTFAYLSIEGEPLHVGCKLPRSNAVALMLPNAKPMEYGLGRSGWVSLDFAGVAAKAIDVDMLKQWIDESYRAQAAKRRIKDLDAAATGEPAAAPKVASAKRKPAAAARRKK